jgi:prepilin-type processing-associated H-X9-DG protein
MQGEVTMMFGRKTNRMNQQSAFTRADLLAVIGVVLLTGFWFGSMHLGEHGRIIRCGGNLAALGKAMHAYAAENDEAIPAAGIDLRKTQASWDVKLFPYLKPNLAKSKGAYELRQLRAGVSPFFVCPSDSSRHRETPRSYAMSGNDMQPEHWPPGRDSATGVGLWWDERTVLSLVSSNALNYPDALPVVKMSDVPDPSDTLLLTEFIDPNNNLGGIRQVTVTGTSQQLQSFKNGNSHFHHDRFNYLMADGHVETLSPLQTGAFDGSAGIWTIKKEN